jgi:phosphotransferase system enzyme I (PtsI)
VRGLRLDSVHPELLDVQLEALALAAADTNADVWVMAPMVSTAAEAAGFAARVRRHGLPTAGAMIEVPAAALCASSIVEHVDFLSIGTNDLSQYTFAADRQIGELAALLDPWQPALLQLIATTTRAARAAGKSVSVCGEAASDPAFAVVLTGLGVTSLSMAASSVGDVRTALAERSLADCEAAAAAALSAATPEEARAGARGAIAE